MGGVYTQKRVLEDMPRAALMVRNGGSIAPPNELIVRQVQPTQTTTSYRSIGSVSGADDALALLRTTWGSSWVGYSPYDNGHPFDTTKETWDLSHPLVDIKGGSFARYRGPLIPASSAELPYASFAPTPGFDPTVYGTKAINATAPNKPIADMANALGELRMVGGIPSVMGTILNFQSRAKFARSAGKEYLNAVFGWTPLVKDIESIAGAVIKSSDLVEQYLRDSGPSRQVRRRYDFPEEHRNVSVTGNVLLSTAFSGLGANYTDLFNPSLGGRAGRAEQVVNHDRKIWFKGAYSYYLEVGDNPLSRMRLYTTLARKLVGARLTPEVLWELQPWSWLVDWFANVGQIMENIEAFQTDGLVLRYGYLMCTDEMHVTTTVYRHGLAQFGPVSRTLRTVRKQRVRATPYGFGLNPETWSPERWAILAALGLTKTPTSLR